MGNLKLEELKSYKEIQKEKRARKVIINCKECGKEVSKKFGTRTEYCSRECRDKKNLQNLKYPNAEWKTKRICLYCEKEFNPVGPSHKLCSIKCRTIFNSFDFKVQNNGASNSGWMKLRFEVFKRDNFTCRYCGRNVKEDKIKLHCDHISPKNKGGKDVLNNLVTACMECNLGKKDVLLENMIKKV